MVISTELCTVKSYMVFLQAYSEPLLLPALADESGGQEILEKKTILKVSEFRCSHNSDPICKA